MCKRPTQCRERRCEAEAEAYWLYKADVQWRRLMRCYEHRPLNRRMLDLWTGVCEYCFRAGKVWRAECHPMCNNYKEGTTMYQEGQTADEVVAKSVHDAEIAALNERITRLRNNYNDLEKKIKEFREVLQADIADDDVDEDAAKRYASIFDFELNREEEFTVVATYSVTIELPLGKSRDDVDEHDFDFSIEYTGYGDMTSSNEDSVEIN